MTQMTVTARWSWKQSPELMERLRAAQNAYDCIDIMTFAGLCSSEAELRAHVERYEALVVKRGR